MSWADSHCHVPWEGSDTSAFDAARAAGVTRFITIGTGAETSRTAIEASAANDDVWATVGLHPHDASQGLDGLPDPSQHERVVAIGECGLDYHYNHSPAEAQRDVFARQIAWAKELDLALVVHTRGAWDETLRDPRPRRNAGAHDHPLLHRRARRSAQVSGPRRVHFHRGIVTFKKADDVRAAAQLVPLDRLLVETDAPFLAPVPYRGKQNEPAYVPLVGAAVADAKGINAAEIEAATWENTALVFRLPS